MIKPQKLTNRSLAAAALRTKLQAGGLYTTKIIGNETKEAIPWTMIKDKTDIMFDELPDETKKEWFDKVVTSTENN